MFKILLLIRRDMIRSDSMIKWNHIVGHSMAQNILIESTILPLQYPELFASVDNGWRCTLLHGPPGWNASTVLSHICCNWSSSLSFLLRN